MSWQADPAPQEHFQLGVWWWRDGDDVVLWHGITGRHVRLHHQSLSMLLAQPDAPRLTGLRQRLDRHYLLAGSPRPPWPDLIPTRSRLVLTLPDEASLWLPVPGFRGPGGHGYRTFRLGPRAHKIWTCINDSRTIAQIADRAGLTLLDVQALCAALTGPELQALQLRDTPPRSRDPGLERLVDLPRPANSRPEHLHGPTGETTLTWYHLHEITDGQTHFDDRETTVAHALAPPHPALRNRPYGAALGEALRRAGALTDHTPVVEVGCGTGELARDLRAAGPTGPYVRVDLSPELLRTQARTASTTHGVLADGLALPFADRSVPLLLSNEVIADMSSVPVDPSEPAEGAPTEALALAERLGLTLPDVPHLVNVGAWRFIQEIARVLAPGGQAWISEFGTLDGLPAEATQLDHPEVAIQFSQLAQVAHACGLLARIAPLAETLGADLTAQHLARSSWHAVRALARSRDHHLQARAYTPATLAEALPFKVEGLRWVPLADEGPGPLITRFYALWMERPAD
ncbi:MAG: methyltransferase domain-containing protein [Deltaproteobacteria bacterium]|nr:MAG: methyltransferase domain-containing protein [Deltaproteobacteria bacterium]